MFACNNEKERERREKSLRVYNSTGWIIESRRGWLVAALQRSISLSFSLFPSFSLSIISSADGCNKALTCIHSRTSFLLLYLRSFLHVHYYGERRSQYSPDNNNNTNAWGCLNTCLVVLPEARCEVISDVPRESKCYVQGFANARVLFANLHQVCFFIHFNLAMYDFLVYFFLDNYI